MPANPQKPKKPFIPQPIKKRPNLRQMKQEHYQSLLSALRQIKDTNERRFALQLVRGIVLPQSKDIQRKVTSQPPISDYLGILSGKPTLIRKATAEVRNPKTKTYTTELTKFPNPEINPKNFLPLLKLLEQTPEFKEHKQEIQETIKKIEKRFEK